MIILCLSAHTQDCTVLQMRRKGGGKGKRETVRDLKGHNKEVKREEIKERMAG